MQSSCIGSLMEIAEQDQRVLYLTADSGEGGLDLMFRRNFSQRSFEFGIAEENLIGAAAGLSSTGKIPFVFTAAPFIAYRAFEFVRDDVCLQNMPVKMIGSGSGISVSSLGPTHHTTEDIGVLRLLPNLTIVSPATPMQAYMAVKYAYSCEGPVYIRLGMNKEKEFFPEDYAVSSIGMDRFGNGDDIVIFSTGSILEEALAAADMLNEKGISVTVINVFLIKPFNAEYANSIIRSIKSAVCVVEEHNSMGGLASIIAENMVDAGISKKLIKVGLEDSFAKGYGTIKQLRSENRLDAKSIFEKLEASVL